MSNSEALATLAADSEIDSATGSAPGSAPGSAGIGAPGSAANTQAHAPADIQAPHTSAIGAGLPDARSAVSLAAVMLAACGGGGGGAEDSPATPDSGPQRDQASGALMVSGLPGSGSARPAAAPGALSRIDAARLLAQASFGPTSVADIDAVRNAGIEAWLWDQFNAPVALHTSFVDMARERARAADPQMREKSAAEHMPYAAIWQQWLNPAAPMQGQLRARVAFALSEIFVISNIAPDIKPYAMAAYMDMLNRNAFGNYRQLLEDVTLHPAMGYYLNMLRSEKGDPTKGTHPNENYAREVLQLFSIGLVKLNADGSQQLGSDGKPIPTYGEPEIKGFAAAFTAWSFGGEGNANAQMWWKASFNNDRNWVVPMLPFATRHSTGSKLLLDGQTIPAGGTPESDMKAALDCIFNHPNVGPFIGRQLIQRLVTSNPSAAYIARVAAVFANDGQGVRGNLAAVVRAILTDSEARGSDKIGQPRYGKLREPVIRFANFLRAMGARSTSGFIGVGDVDNSEHPMGQSPLLAPSVFNFFSPNFRPSGPLTAASLVAPEFQVTNEVTVVGSLNFFKNVIWQKYYQGCDMPSDWKLTWNYNGFSSADTEALIEQLELLFCCGQMSGTPRGGATVSPKGTKDILREMLTPIPANQTDRRMRNALIVCMAAPDYVVQK